jgi:hypothetical protein
MDYLRLTELQLGEGWQLVDSSTPEDKQYLNCLRRFSPPIPLLCIYDGNSRNFYQVFHRIGKRSTSLKLSIVEDVVAFKPIVGIGCIWEAQNVLRDN